MRWFSATGITIAATVILIIITSAIHPNWTYDPPSDQCEIASGSNPNGPNNPTVLEPWDTWSNLAYLFAGLLILFSTQRLLGYAFGGYLCLLAICSGAYHASLQAKPQFLDVAGIYLLLFAAVFYALESAIFNLRGTRIPQEWLIAFIPMPVLGFPMAWWRTKVCLFDSTTVFIIFAVLFTGLILRQMSVVDIKCLVIVLGLISAGSFFFRLTDGQGKLFCHTTGFQAHAIWHILSAVALLLLYDLFAWIGGDVRILPESSPSRIVGAEEYPRLTMAGWALAAGIFFLLDALLKLKFLFQTSDQHNCMVTGILVAAVFLVLAPLTFFKIIKL